MIRSLGLVMILVVALWFFAQPSPGDAQKVRDVDPSADITAFQGVDPGAPVPGSVPAGWQVTSSTLGGDPTGLRIGYLTGADRHVEYAAFKGGDTQTLPSLTGSARALGPVDVGGTAWQRYRDDDGSLSLVRPVGPDGVTVVVGTLRATAPEADLRLLAGTLTS